ncbi:hypothetical protein D1007_54184 [Hordeum vulgare]|nr:hypothetical protein D1007_54184 [Hordeum vulgare]
MQGPTADLLCFTFKNLPSFIAMEPILSFLKDTFYGGSSASSADKSVLIDYANKGTLSISSKGKNPIHDREGTVQPCFSKTKEPICDIREGTLHPCSFKTKEHICDNKEHTQDPCSSNGKEPIYDRYICEW